jgi:hypothetical protein
MFVAIAAAQSVYLVEFAMQLRSFDLTVPSDSEWTSQPG